MYVCISLLLSLLWRESCARALSLSRTHTHPCAHIHPRARAHARTYAHARTHTHALSLTDLPLLLWDYKHFSQPVQRGGQDVWRDREVVV